MAGLGSRLRGLAGGTWQEQVACPQPWAVELDGPRQALQSGESEPPTFPWDAQEITPGGTKSGEVARSTLEETPGASGEGWGCPLGRQSLTLSELLPLPLLCLAPQGPTQAGAAGPGAPSCGCGAQWPGLLPGG